MRSYRVLVHHIRFNKDAAYSVFPAFKKQFVFAVRHLYFHGRALIELYTALIIDMDIAIFVGRKGYGNRGFFFRFCFWGIRFFDSQVFFSGINIAFFCGIFFMCKRTISFVSSGIRWLDDHF